MNVPVEKQGRRENAMTAYDVRRALKNNCLNVYHDLGPTVCHRVVCVREQRGVLQVKHLGDGRWYIVTGKLNQR